MYLAVQQGQEKRYTTLDVRSKGFSLFFLSSEAIVKLFENTILKSICGKLRFKVTSSCFLILKLSGPKKGILIYLTSFLTVVTVTAGKNLLFKNLLRTLSNKKVGYELLTKYLRNLLISLWKVS